MTNVQNPDNQFVATENIATAGAISYWRLSGDTRLEDLRAAWAAAGLDEKLLPDEPSGRVALSRALRDCEGKVNENTRRQAIKAQSGWWGLVEIDTDANGNISTRQIVKARYAETGVVVDTALWALEQQIRTAAKTHTALLAPTDVSAWLIKLADSRAAIGLRDSGGIYFVPRGQVDFWNTVAAVVQSLGEHRVFRIPALQTDEAVEAIVDALTQEAEAIGNALLADLTAEGDDAPGARALRTKAQKAEELLGKVRQYEDLLGVKLDAQVAKIQATAARVAAFATAHRDGLAQVSETVAAGVGLAALTVTDDSTSC